jgi:hypothetical protein
VIKKKAGKLRSRVTEQVFIVHFCHKNATQVEKETVDGKRKMYIFCECSVKVLQ